MKKLLTRNPPIETPNDLIDTEGKWFNAIGIWSLCTAVLLIGGCIVSKPAHAYTDEQIVNAIYLAEGGAKTAHPYGILAKYKHTTPRQACLNTIKHKHIQWLAAGGKGDFLIYLSQHYCPVGAANDPGGLNRNWVKNVRYFLNKKNV